MTMPLALPAMAASSPPTLARTDEIQDVTIEEYGGPLSRSKWVSQYASQCFGYAAEALESYELVRKVGDAPSQDARLKAFLLSKARSGMVVEKECADHPPRCELCSVRLRRGVQSAVGANTARPAADRERAPLAGVVYLLRRRSLRGSVATPWWRGRGRRGTSTAAARR
jgi:hypothetical protein